MRVEIRIIIEEKEPLKNSIEEDWWVEESDNEGKMVIDSINFKEEGKGGIFNLFED
jgi:hypothetical protein